MQSTIEQLNTFSSTLKTLLFAYEHEYMISEQIDVELQAKLYRIIDNIEQTTHWSTRSDILFTLHNIANACASESIEAYIKQHQISPTPQPKTVALILQELLPGFGFWDILPIIIRRENCVCKCDLQTHNLLKLLCDILCSVAPDYKERIIFTEQKLPKFDKVIIALNTDKVDTYKQYFKQYPLLILPHNKKSVAILDGTETIDELKALGSDMLRYFGISSQNVSKIYLPQGFDFNLFFAAIEPFSYVFRHHRFGSMYEYNKFNLLFNNSPHFDNGFVLLVESEDILNHTAVFHYTYYNDLHEISTLQNEQIEHIVSKQASHYTFGTSTQQSIHNNSDIRLITEFLNSNG